VESVFDGVKIIEVAQWTLVPAASMVFADFGADVIKIENPLTGDPQRGLVSAGAVPGAHGVNFIQEQTNRGKRSLTLNLRDPRGRRILGELVGTADVFVTNYLPGVRSRLRIDEDSIRADNPGIVYASALGQGSHGPDAGKGGYDAAMYWARGGVAWSLAEGDGLPPVQPGGFGDKAAAMNLAFGIAAGLFRRSQTGHGGSVETSLLATALWQNSSAVTYSLGLGADFRRQDRPVSNPIVHVYATSDGRAVSLVMLQSDRYWPDLCTRIGRPDLITDERFRDSAARQRNATDCIAELQAVFGTQPLAHWREQLADAAGPWAPVQTTLEAAADVQTLANAYLAEVDYGDGVTAQLVHAPVQFDDGAPALARGPELGQHTEEVLLEMGMDWPEILALKDEGIL
jgi:crotonobetainyl-CoA:carnitine CoA-transferase CaiB-like acyl-CoA transferase